MRDLGLPEGSHPEGSAEGGLAFENESGQVLQITGQSLARLFECCVSHVRCVVLNACYSEVQANAIVQHIDYVIGMNKAVGDEAAIRFAEGFYDCPPGRETLRSRFQVRLHRDRSARNPRAPHSGTEEEAEPRSGGSRVCRSSRTSSRGPRNSWKSTGRRGWHSTRCSRVGTDRPGSSRGGTGCQGSGRLPGPLWPTPWHENGPRTSLRSGNSTRCSPRRSRRRSSGSDFSDPCLARGQPTGSPHWFSSSIFMALDRLTDMRLNESVRVAISSLPWTGNSPWLRLPLLS